MNEIYLMQKKIPILPFRASLPDEAVKSSSAARPSLLKEGVIVIAIGKAAWNMAKAAAENIPHRIDAGIVLTKYDHAKGEIPDLPSWKQDIPLPMKIRFSAHRKSWMPFPV